MDRIVVLENGSVTEATTTSIHLSFMMTSLDSDSLSVLPYDQTFDESWLSTATLKSTSKVLQTVVERSVKRSNEREKLNE